jgi:glyoxylate/hydroxypyruvate reductase A
MSILLLGKLSEAEYAVWQQHLSLHLPADETLVLASQAYDKTAVDIALVANPPAGALATLPKLRFVQSLWAGVDRLLSDPSLPENVPLARLVDPAMTRAMTECALANVFYLHRQLPAYLRQQAHRQWQPRQQVLAAQRRVGVLGMGKLGAAVAQALADVGFPVMGWSRQQGSDGLTALLSRTDILINLLPLTAHTTGILNAALFEKLPVGAALINLARGGHLVEPDLLAALEQQHISHAVLDVFNEEPLPERHPFWTHPQITVFPHVAAATDPATAARVAAENIVAFRAGRAIGGLVSHAQGY